ncbi:N amino acid transport system protein [Verticillium dahliae VDG2]|nr:N amino acid transport system protein [Verticillium dahliae VDG2]
MATAAPLPYHNKIFTSASNTANGEVSSATRFHYRQEGKIVWAEYGGGSIVKGFLIATVADDESLDMRYEHVNVGGALMTGRCRSVPERLADGRLRMHETWRWTSGDGTAGESVVEEPSVHSGSISPLCTLTTTSTAATPDQHGTGIKPHAEHRTRTSIMSSAQSALRYVAAAKTSSRGTLHLRCYVKPGAAKAREGVTGLTEDAIEICVAAQPRQGEANKAVLRLLSEASSI